MGDKPRKETGFINNKQIQRRKYLQWRRREVKKRDRRKQSVWSGVKYPIFKYLIYTRRDILLFHEGLITSSLYFIFLLRGIKNNTTPFYDDVIIPLHCPVLIPLITSGCFLSVVSFQVLLTTVELKERCEKYTRIFPSSLAFRHHHTLSTVTSRCSYPVL